MIVLSEKQAEETTLKWTIFAKPFMPAFCTIKALKKKKSINTFFLFFLFVQFYK